MNLDFLNTIDIPIIHQNTIEYEISKYCSFVYDLETYEKYLSYIDLTTGEEVEEVLDSFSERIINNTLITYTDFDIFTSLIPNIQQVPFESHFF